MLDRRTPWMKFKNSLSWLFESDITEGLLLIAGVVIALVAMNSPWHDAYHHFWQKELLIEVGEWRLKQNFHHLVNDGLMALFFFLVGLEIKREVVAGELSTWRKAILPVFAALGGMVLPAIIYLIVVSGGAMRNGWGIPMATDIAFALVLLRVLRNRVPLGLQVFLAALAVADDLGAIVIIAVFYTDTIVVGALIIAFAAFALLLIANKLGVRSPGFYAAVGILGIWLAILQSGVHATIAGVLIAMAIPANKLVRDKNFPKRVQKLGRKFDDKKSTEDEMMTEPQLEVLQRVNKLTLATAPPLQRIERQLSPFVSYVVLPLFALSNAGVKFSGDWQESLFNPVSIGIVAGLVIGKVVGIMLFTRMVTWLNLASIPANIKWNHLLGAACFAGIGFTMSLFIAQLAFDNESLIQSAKMGILIASTIAAALGLGIFLKTTKPVKGLE